MQSYQVLEKQTNKPLADEELSFDKEILLGQG